MRMLQRVRALIVFFLLAAAGWHGAAMADEFDRLPDVTGEVFKDLPGVKPPRKNTVPDPYCEPGMAESRASKLGKVVDVPIYRCDMGGFQFGGTQMPNEIEYRKFKEYYQR